MLSREVNYDESSSYMSSGMNEMTDESFSSYSSDEDEYSPKYARKDQDMDLADEEDEWEKFV